MPRSILVALLLLFAGVAWWVLSSRNVDGAPTPLPESRPAAPSPPPPTVTARGPAPVATKAPDPEAKRRMLKLPNGEYVPALNGVIDAPAMDWPTYIPYSPIVGRESSSTLEWYVHADGTRSTTQMIFLPELGRLGPVTTIANPAPTGQLPPGEPGTEQKRGGAGQGAKR